ncbi:MAG: cephalosporin hydroxylase family protein [Deltaproteobacteria bacterium]|nr:cephalosporin hydroxylase family protein [Deltaproteobacteria bacterium]MBW2342552.1 cephalosporin hydroxylase family protein [Deltaproteobacteria bacterium]
MQFEQARERRIKDQGKNVPLIDAANNFQEGSIKSLYSYNFSWMGRPLIQYPQDIVVMQEILWKVKPDLVVETGIAHGGSIIFYSSILELIGKGLVLGIDVDIRTHNRKLIEAHPMFNRIEMIEGDSVSEEVFAQVREIAGDKRTVLVCLDSMHTHEHVIKELELYSSIVTKGSYLVVFDTIIEDLSEDCIGDRSWGKGNNPKTAVHEFIKKTDRFVIDKAIENKLLITVAPDGYLKCVK